MGWSTALAATGSGGAIGRTALACVIPMAAAVAGSAWAARRPPGARVRSAIQHFAAGLVFAVAATELIPDLEANHRTAAVIGGFTVGVAAMLAIDVLAKRAGTGSESLLPMLVVTGVDLTVDGLLLGIAFSEGGAIGPLLTFALTMEMLGLGVALALVVLDTGATKARTVATTAAVSCCVLVGGVLGASVLSNLGAGALSVVLAFAVAALLYLVTEELLTEAHETEDTPLLTATFFVGFLIVLVLSFNT